MIVSLSGFAGSGKDTAAQYLVQHYGFRRRAFADKLKEILITLDPVIPIRYRTWLHLSEILQTKSLEWAKNEYPEVRRLLQVLGTEVGRDMIDKNIWVNLAMNGVERRDNYVFTDTRFPNEFTRLRYLGARMVYIQRPGIKPPNDHVSEKALIHYEYDVYVSNDGTPEQLGQRLVRLLQLEYEPIKAEGNSV